MSGNAQKDAELADLPIASSSESRPGIAKLRAAERGARFRFIDFLIIVLCVFCAGYALNMFRIDLFSTINLKNEQPVGTITIKNNVVQRRLSDRALWDRLSVESPVYLGDLIRVAELSAATLNIDASHIDLNENTLIRIQRIPGEEGLFEIELSEGSLSLNAGAQGGGIMLNLMGRQVEAGAGTVLNAATGKDGMVLSISEGAALFVQEGQRREVSSGTMIALDTMGTERTEPAAVVTNPPPNARYLKKTPEPLNISFAWNRLFLQPDELLRLELAGDRNFSRIIHVIEKLNSSAEAALEAGSWYWRLRYANSVLSTGRFTVTEASGPELMNPVTDSVYRYNSALPTLRFQWSEIEGASSYHFEASLTPNFVNTQMSRQVAAAFLVDSSLGPGTWYWRVMPVFPAAYEGSAAFSPASFFHIEQQSGISEGSPAEELIIELPEPVLVVEDIPVEIKLLAPVQEARLPGLTALREQTVFRWEYDGEVAQSRFILSGSSNPFDGRPVTEIANPGQTVRLDRLGEGIWYWTVEAKAVNGLISAAEPRQLQVLPIPLLPAPGNRQPAAGSRIGIDQLRNQRRIVFRWEAVPGANAYIFTLSQQTSGGRRQIIRTEPENRTSWTLENISVLDRGTFVWQVEAVNRGRNNVIEQRGRIADNSFVLDVPLPGPVKIEDPGILYGR